MRQRSNPRKRQDSDDEDERAPRQSRIQKQLAPPTIPDDEQRRFELKENRNRKKLNDERDAKIREER